MSLLQGFNVTSADSLSNLIALANEQFSHKHVLSFVSGDYDRIIGIGETTQTGPFGELLHVLDDMRLHLGKREAALNVGPKDLIGAIAQLLHSDSIEHQSRRAVHSHAGCRDDLFGEANSRGLIIHADPIAMHATFFILIRIIEAILTKGVEASIRRERFYFAIRASILAIMIPVTVPETPTSRSLRRLRNFCLRTP